MTRLLDETEPPRPLPGAKRLVASCRRFAAVRCRFRRNRWLLVSTAALSLAACGDDDGSAVTIQITAPASGQVLTLDEDDADPDQAGLQFDVIASSTGLSLGTTLNLFIDGERRADDGRVDLEGDVTLEHVTLPPGRHTIHLETTTASASSNHDHAYTFRGIRIASPADGATIKASDDRDAIAAGVQIDVSAESFGIQVNEEVVLLLDGEPTSEPAMPDDEGAVVWSRIEVSNGRHTLQAQVGEGAHALHSDEVDFDVQDSCPSVTFLTPTPPTGEANTLSLGGDGECPSGSDPFTADFMIATNAEEGVSVQLLVNRQQVATGTVTRSTVTFSDVPLSRRTSPNSVQVTLETPEGADCAVPFPVDIMVDCAGVDCAIASPMPVQFTDDAGGTSLYLNAALRGDDGFAIDVQSDDEIDGREVELIVDGNSRNALRAAAEADGDVSIARFDALDLSEGSHTFEALCTDDAGNVTSSGELTWIVDVTACEVELTDPADGAIFVPADDEDGASTGTQVVTSAMVSGGDCVAQRAAICDPDDGIGLLPDFAGYDGTSPLLSTVTLDDSLGVQALCLEIADRAGNAALGSVAVTYRATAPSVLIETPADGDRYNALGGSGYVADADSFNSPTACDAEFWIACSELGADVQLHHDDPSGAVFASAPCEQADSADPALPEGYAGRAKITALFGDGDQSATIVATQELDGSSGTVLVGASPAIAIEGDCRRPAVSFFGNPCNAPGNQLEVADAGSRSFSVVDNTGDMTAVVLTLAHAGGASATPAPSSMTATTADYAGIDLVFGGEGDVTVQAIVSDDFANSGEVQCTVAILQDVPQIVGLASPGDGAVFGPGDGCDTGTIGEFGVLVSATIDQLADREVDLVVNGTTVRDNVAITAGAGGTGVIQDVCVPVPDNLTHGGPSTVTVRADSTVGEGFAEESRDVHVVLGPPAEGIVIDPLDPGDPTDDAFRDAVVAIWTKPTEQWPGQLVDYELRCAGVELDMADKELWWNTADAVDLPAALTPDDDDPSAALVHRPQEPRHCVVRALDVAGNPTPIVESTDLTMVLRQTVVTAGTGTQGVGFRVVAAGDVDDDGYGDLLVGGFGRAELLFGTPADSATASKVVFTTIATATVSLAGLGDFNGDGIDDFAIGSGVINGNAGRLSIFFGRPRAQWPAMPIDIETLCTADLCIEGTTNTRAGRLTASAGDFDADGRPDVAIASVLNDEIFVLLGADYEVRDCSACRVVGESCVSSVCTRDVTPGAGEPAFWRLRFSLPTGDPIDPASGPTLEGFELTSGGAFGVSVAGLGDFDSEPGADLAIGASTAARVDFLSGREYAGPGIETLTTAELGLPDPTTGVPSNLPISAQAVSAYGFVIANLGDFYEVPGATSAKTDLGIARVNVDELFVAPGDAMSANDPGFSQGTLHITGSGNIGQSIATSLSPVYDLLGDLDGDGEPELCIGTRTATPHDILLWYPDQFAAAVDMGTVTRASGISITVQTTDTAELATQFVGDFNGDGHLDLAVGDYRANGGAGRLVLLY